MVVVTAKRWPCVREFRLDRAKRHHGEWVARVAAHTRGLLFSSDDRSAWQDCASTDLHSESDARMGSSVVPHEMCPDFRGDVYDWIDDPVIAVCAPQGDNELHNELLLDSSD